MNIPAYVRPVAYHRDYPHRLLVKDEAGIWRLWQGDGSTLVEIDRSLAEWLYHRPEMYPIASQSMWFHPMSLPVSVDSATYSRH